MRIGVDLMGSDCSPTVLYEGVECSLQDLPTVTFVLFVTQVVLDQLLLRLLSLPPEHASRILFRVASEVIEMDEAPILALHQKQHSSLSLGLDLLNGCELDAFVSAGNTGALIAGTALSLPLFPGVTRPALLALLPTETGNVVVIDVGGSVSCKATQLVQFARLGAAYQRCCFSIPRPRVGLLNIGIELNKGTPELCKTYQQMQMSINQVDLEFIGNIEGGDVFEGVVDVLVTDGFTGNIFLKTSEGVSRFFLKKLEQALQGLPANDASRIFNALSYQFNDEEYNGAVICGLERIVVKCHGMSTQKGLYQGIKQAADLVQKNFINEMRKLFSESTFK